MCRRYLRYFASNIRSWKGELPEDRLSIVLFVVSKYKLQHRLQELLSQRPLNQVLIRY